MEEDAGGESTLGSIPLELLSEILLFIPTQELYPSCFLVSKYFLKALELDVGWQSRCEQELVAREDESRSWKHAYRGTRFFLLEEHSGV